MPREYVDNEIINSFMPRAVSDKRKKIKELLEPIHISNDEASVVENRLRMAIVKGLTKDGNPTSSIKCLPTFVTKLPTGEEDGHVVALDLGGTNFRVLLVDLVPGNLTIQSDKYPVPENLMTGSGNALFDFIAECIAKFLVKQQLGKHKLALGFTFSFPAEQKSLKTGYLLRWTKGFNCSDVVGEDVCKLLQEAIDRRNDVDVELVALLNDTTGTLLSCAYRNDKCRVGLIVGTGCNACYLEEVKNVETYEPQPGDTDTHIVINTEWGAFGEHGELDFIETKWDAAVDAESINPGKQIYEKMISGMYMGEIVRHILVDCATQGLMFKNIDFSGLCKKEAFPTKFICEIEYDPIGKFERNRNCLIKIFGRDSHITDEDCSIVRYVCEEVSRRTAMLLGSGLAGLLKKMNYHDVVIAVDGTLFRMHPLFYAIMKKKITQLMGVKYKFDLMLSEDGSGQGAAIIAAVIAHQEPEKFGLTQKNSEAEQKQ